MANLWIIMTGLGILVDDPDKPENPGAVLMRRVRPDALTVGGKSVLPHEPTMMLRPGGARILVGGRSVEFIPRGEGAPKLAKSNRELFIPVGKGLARPARIQKSRLEGDGLGDAGTTVVLAGGWLEPIHVDQNFQLGQVSRNINVDLVGLFDPDSGVTIDLARKPVANGLLYRRKIESADEGIFASVGEEKFQLSPVEKEEMGNLRENDGDDDYVAWIVNVADEYYGDSGQDPEVDPDFQLLYQWLDEDVQVKYVPKTDRRRAPDTGDGYPPGMCVHGLALAPLEEE